MVGLHVDAFHLGIHSELVIFYGLQHRPHRGFLQQVFSMRMLAPKKG